MIDNQIKMKLYIIVLWITILFNMIFADIFSIIVEFIEGGAINILGNVKTIMAIASIITNIPILMILLTWVLPYKRNRIVNMIAAIFTIIYIVFGGILLPHYLILGAIQTTLLCTIFIKSYKWEE